MNIQIKMREPREIILTEITVSGRTLQLEYVCDICYVNPRLKRKHLTHYHGGGFNTQDKYFNEIDWNKRLSFGTRVPHCSNNFIEYSKHGCVSHTSPLIQSLPEVELIYEPEITKIPFLR
jgi:hypothetical protein